MAIGTIRKFPIAEAALVRNVTFKGIGGGVVVRVKPLLIRTLPLILFALFGVP